MPRMCAVCGKIYSRTIKRSHSMRPSIVRLLPNLQYAVFDGKRLKACTRCIKTKAKTARVRA
ncbi:MAG: L28 family ribosomal protein [Candidatus Doudnabacteria bacterium]|nr:L28 family ribosomal protein [Candidatus Doudnabacteria bacterium]